MKRVSGGLTIFFLALALSVFLAYGCSQKKVSTEPAVEEKTAEQKAEEEAMKRPEAEKITEKEMQAAKEKEKISEQRIAKAETSFEKYPEKYVELKAENIQDIHFDFDKYDIREDAKPPLEKALAYLKDNPKAKLLIEGHCDERGTNEYNLALGDRRASSTKSYLVAAGMPAKRIEMVSFGEEKPLCTEQNEECWQKNRRSHFVFLEEKM